MGETAQWFCVYRGVYRGECLPNVYSLFSTLSTLSRLSRPEPGSSARRSAGGARKAPGCGSVGGWRLAVGRLAVGPQPQLDPFSHCLLVSLDRFAVSGTDLISLCTASIRLVSDNVQNLRWVRVRLLPLAASRLGRRR